MARFLDSELLRRVRVELGLSQEQAAERLGMNVRSYRRYETGAVNDPVSGFTVRHARRGRVTDRICAELGLTESELLPERASTPGEPARGRVNHPLPRPRHFVGRTALAAELGAWAREPSPEERVVALVAIGGAGKTALLERVVRELPAFVWSFYEDSRVDAFLREAVRCFAPTSQREGLERLEEALAAGPPHLLALDGLEVVQASGGGGRARGELEDTTLRRLLRSLANGLGGARALVTSRFELADLAPFEGARTVRLPDLTRAEAVELLERWGVAGSRAARERLARRFGGHALSVAVAGSYATAFHGGDPDGLTSLAHAADDDPLARRLADLLEDYARALAPLERDLLARLAAFPGGASVEALVALAQASAPIAGALAGADAATLGGAARRLERLGLATRGRDVLLVHPFVRERFLGLLGVSPEELHRVEHARLSLAARPDAIGAAVAEDAGYLDRAEAVLLATLRAGQVNEAVRAYDGMLGGFGRLGLRTGDMVRGERILRAFAVEGDPARLDPRLEAEERAIVAYDRGLYATALGDLALARRCYEALEVSAPSHAGRKTLAIRVVGLRTHAYVARLGGDLAGARSLVARSIALAESHGLAQHVVRGLALEASVCHDQGDVAGAAARFAQVRAIEGEPEARRALWEAEHAAALGETARARAIAERVHADCAALGWEGHVAHAATVLGLLDLSSSPADSGGGGREGAPRSGVARGREARTPPPRSGALAAAREHLARARRWADAAGEVEVRLRAHVLAGRLALAEERLPVAGAEAAAGQRLAESCGFTLAAVRLRTLEATVALASGEAALARALAAEAALAAESCGDFWGAAAANATAAVAAGRRRGKSRAGRPRP